MGQLINGKDIIVLNYVESSLTDELLGCHYKESALWSPLVRRFHYLKVAPVDDISPRTPKPSGCCSSSSYDEVNRKLLFCSGGGGDQSFCRKKSKMKLKQKHTKQKKKRDLAMSFFRRKIGRFAALNFGHRKQQKLGFMAEKATADEKCKVASRDGDCFPVRSGGKVWEKALKITSNQFKKKKKKQKIKMKDVSPPYRMTLADYLQLDEDFY